MRCSKLLYDYCIENNIKYLLDEWDYEKNGQVTPYNISYGSSKKVCWKCSKKHEWCATITKRTNGRNCPYCSGRIATKENNLGVKNPQLVKEWHPTKNGTLTPYEVTPNSHKKVWWLCSKGHEWQSKIDNRNNGCDCPYCNKETQTSFPEQAIYYYIKQMFPDTINAYKPTWLNHMEIDIYIPSLNLGIEYDGQAFHSSNVQTEKDNRKNKLCNENDIVLIRVRETGSPLLKESNDFTINCSIDKQYLYLNKIIKKVIDFINNKYNLNKSININIEKDKNIIYSSFLDTEKKNSLSFKNKELSKEWNYEKNKPLMPDMISCNSGKQVWWLCKNGHEWKSRVSDRNKGKGCPYCSGRFPTKENNLAVKNPQLASEWHPKKNGKLTPYDVTAISGKKIWWICSKNPTHEWKSTVSNRINGKGCPYCSNQKVHKDNCLATLYPEIAKEWHPVKNGSLTPCDFTKSSGKKVWWKCKEGHEWEAVICDRTSGKGCRTCYQIKRQQQKEEFIKKAIILKENGLNNKQIAKELNLSISYVRKLLIKS